MIHSTRVLFRFLSFACAVASLTDGACAQWTADTISLTGLGGASLVPNALEARFELATNAETAKAALEQLETKSRKAEAALGEIPGVAVRSSEARLTAHGRQRNANRNIQVRVVGGGAVWVGGAGRGVEQDASFSAGRTMVARLEGFADKSQAERIEAVARLLDASRDAGLSVIQGLDKIRGQARVFGNSRNPNGDDSGGPFSFVGGKDTALKNAQRAALQDARQRAGQIAALAGRKLGPVKSLEIGRVTTPSDKLALGGMITVELKIVFTLE